MLKVWYGLNPQLSLPDANGRCVPTLIGAPAVALMGIRNAHLDLIGGQAAAQPSGASDSGRVSSIRSMQFLNRQLNRGG
jgi:hypothetical protein